MLACVDLLDHLCITNNWLSFQFQTQIAFKKLRAHLRDNNTLFVYTTFMGCIKYKKSLNATRRYTKDLFTFLCVHLLV